MELYAVGSESFQKRINGEVKKIIDPIKASH